MNKQVANISILENFRYSELEIRIRRLEEKAFKNKRKTTTLGQQIVFLHELGMLDPIYQLPLNSFEKKAHLLARILNQDPSNTKKALEAIPKREETDLKIPFNYDFLSELFEEFGANEHSSDMAQKSKKLLQQKKQKKNS